MKETKPNKEEKELKEEVVEEKEVVETAETTEIVAEKDEVVDSIVEPVKEESPAETTADGETTMEEVESVKTEEETTKLEDKEVETIEEPKKLETKTFEMKETKHRFDPDDKVFVSDFRNMRDDKGYTKIANQFRFAPLEGEIERVVITKVGDTKIIQYKLKNKAGSLYDEEDVCATVEEAEELCKEKNRG